jgi:hypothetical protein
MPLSTNFFSFMVFMCYVLYNFLQKKKKHGILFIWQPWKPLNSKISIYPLNKSTCIVSEHF